MSHLVQIHTKVRDPDAVVAALRGLGLAAPTVGTAQLFSGEATGLIVKLPAWEYPVVINTHSGVVNYDNYLEAWGEQRELDRLLQMYAVEKARSEARKQGCTVTEQLLQDGSIKLQIAQAT